MLNNDATFSELKCELPRYIALADGVSMEVERTHMVENPRERTT